MEFKVALRTVCTELGFTYDLKAEQVQIIDSAVNGESVFGLLPTGYGKSHCFALVPLVLDKINPQKHHIALVVSPLRSLMMDLVRRYRGIGVKCVAILKQEEMSDEDMHGLESGEFSIVFCSPEALLNQRWWSLFEEWGEKICCLTVDEAHCLTTWGKDFRASYQRVVEVRSIFPDCPVMPLTATATSKMMEEILEGLHLEKRTRLVAVLPDRPNIFLMLQRVNGIMSVNLKWVAENIQQEGNDSSKTLIYARTVDHATQIFGTLMQLLKEDAWVDGDKTSRKLRVELYHGSTDPEKQKTILRRFTSEHSLKVVVATVAFGMGVQVDDVASVVHWGPSRTVLDYWQEIGRCARDGQPGQAYLYIPPRSLDPRHLSPEMLETVKRLLSQNICIRKTFLEHLYVEGMSKEQLSNCSIPTERCCSNCKAS